MATIGARQKADGDSSYRVVWRAGGTRYGVWECETFAGRRAAGRFRRDVDLAGQQWPESRVPARYRPDSDAAAQWCS